MLRDRNVTASLTSSSNRLSPSRYSESRNVREMEDLSVSDAEIAFLRKVARDLTRAQSSRKVGEIIGVAHVTVLNFADHRTDRGSEKLREALKRYLEKRRQISGEKLRQLAFEYARKHPEDLPRSRTTTVEYDVPSAPVLGAMPGYDDAEAAARERYPMIPAHVWGQIRDSSGAAFRPPVTAEFLADLAIVIFKHARPAPED